MPGKRWTLGRGALVLLLAAVLGGCATQPPSRQHDLCAIFSQHPGWYDAARESRETWGVPIPVQMAFVRHESAFRAKAKPPFEWFLFIPRGRPSSAKGYAQAVDSTWEDYKAERGGLFSGRSDMADALDFIGWYNDTSSARLGLSKQDAKSLYLAYHEGHVGYRRGSYENKPRLLRIAGRVAQTARRYEAQLQRCEERFACRKWYQVGPLCG